MICRIRGARFAAPVPYSTLIRSNDGRLDLLVQRGAWTHRHGEIPNSLLIQQKDSTFVDRTLEAGIQVAAPRDRQSTRLNSSHVESSYAVFCLQKKRDTHPTAAGI